MIGLKSAIAFLLLLSIDAASQDHIDLLTCGVTKWNEWRKQHGNLHLDFKGAVLQGALLPGANLSGADLQGADLGNALLDDADLQGSHLRGANLDCANLQGAHLEGAHLQGANLRGTNFGEADLRKAILWGTDLQFVASFYRAKLDTEVLYQVKLQWPEKLATVWDQSKKGWIVDKALLEQIKKPEWRGWPE
jgi:uncharacterized protein YjbI with pentapeptide repeats